MNPELKVKWIEALRSGNFKQARGKLTADGGMCCLGVLREVMAPSSTDSRNGNGEMLSDEHLKIAGIPDASDNDFKCAGGLASLNDEGHTFLELAQIIEENL